MPVFAAAFGKRLRCTVAIKSIAASNLHRFIEHARIPDKRSHVLVSRNNPSVGSHTEHAAHTTR
jgi:hypothetical protein